MPRFGAMNLHPSLLPRHRGASPIQADDPGRRHRDRRVADAHGRRPRHRPGHCPAKAAPEPHETAPELEATLALLAADLLHETLEQWLSGAIEAAATARRRRHADPPAHAAKTAAWIRWPESSISIARCAPTSRGRARSWRRPEGRVIVWEARPLDAGASRRAGTLLRLPANRLALTAQDGLLELLRGAARRRASNDRRRAAARPAGAGRSARPFAVRGHWRRFGVASLDGSGTRRRHAAATSDQHARCRRARSAPRPVRRSTPSSSAPGSPITTSPATGTPAGRPPVVERRAVVRPSCTRSRRPCATS